MSKVFFVLVCMFYALSAFANGDLRDRLQAGEVLTLIDVSRDNYCDVNIEFDVRSNILTSSVAPTYNGNPDKVCAEQSKKFEDHECFQNLTRCQSYEEENYPQGTVAHVRTWTLKRASASLIKEARIVVCRNRGGCANATPETIHFKVFE